jgi:hypothetical protein
MVNKKYELRRKLKKLIQKRKNERVKFIENNPPRYDEVYWEGIKWLDSL